jgi:hypothetical protein
MVLVPVAVVAACWGASLLVRRQRRRVRLDVEVFRGARVALEHAARRAASECNQRST